MKAPDKIYIHTKDNPLEITFSEVEEKDTTNIAYIRKEALLKWARERKEQVGIGLSEYDAGHENGIYEVLNEQIKHINSL